MEKEIIVPGGFKYDLEFKSSTGTTDLGSLTSIHE